MLGFQFYTVQHDWFCGCLACFAWCLMPRASLATLTLYVGLRLVGSDESQLENGSMIAKPSYPGTLW